MIGVPANAPARPETPAAYLPVHDLPPPREETVLTSDQQKKLQTELLSARDKTNAEAGALAKSTPTDDGKPQSKVQAKSAAKRAAKKTAAQANPQAPPNAK